MTPNLLAAAANPPCRECGGPATVSETASVIVCRPGLNGDWSYDPVTTHWCEEHSSFIAHPPAR